MVQMIYDPEHLVSLTGWLTISTIFEYVSGYARILESLQNGQEINVVVSQHTVFQWMKNLSQRYPQGTFIFETSDARQALGQKWGVILPIELRNEEILESGLLAFDLQTQPGQSFDDILLAHFYSPLLSAKTFPFTRLTQLFDSIDAARWQANRSKPLLARTLHQRLEDWKKNAGTSEQRQFVEWFSENPTSLNKQLMEYRILRAYPALGESLLGDAYPILASLKLQLQDLAIDEESIPSVLTQVTYQLNAYKPQSAEDFSALIAQVSGLIWVEFETLEKLLLAHPEWISSAIIDQLVAKFETFSRRIARRLAELRYRIRPAKPESPNVEWDVLQMLDWATNAYLPYQAWCSAREQFDKDLYTIGDKFSEWLMNNWDDIHANSGRMVFNVLPNIAAEFKDLERIHLILVVDNLGWSFAESLRDLFTDRGFYLLTSIPYLAMIPTETENSKKCLLSGAVGSTSIDEKSYKSMLEKGWVPYFQDNAFRYISDIGSLSKVDTIDARTYVVNYLAVDVSLHKSSEEIGISHREHVRHLLEKLVENVSAFVDKHALQDRIRIHVVSDHGSTQVPADMQNDIDTAFFKQSGFEARSHRYLEVSNERFATLADNLKLDCFFLPTTQYLLPNNVLCARRANRFLQTDQNSYVHGGVLPEEVIVPYMAFEQATLPLKDLTVLLNKNEFRYRLETVELEIGNPNDAAVEQVRVSTLNGNVEWEFEPIALLLGKTKTVRQVSARFKLTSLPEEQTTLNLRLRFSSRGETHAFDIKFPILMRKIVQEKGTSVFDD